MKKLLALVLALVMTLSLCVTSNAAFTDAKDVDADFEEAVAVLSGMGVFKGYEDGSFKPEGSITRAEVAAIVYRLYTGDVKDKQAGLYAGYGKFDDMAGAQWAAGYVGFCANAGFIKGYGNGKFGPSDPVTGYQALAMILRAVGYGQNGEFEGADWELHVAQVAQQLKVLKNVKDVSLKTAASRQLVAELLFQVAAKVNTVTYTPAFGYQDTTLSNTFKTDGVRNETLGEKNFDLYKEADGQDDWGRPCYKWTNAFDEVEATYAASRKAPSFNKDHKDYVCYATVADTPVMTFTEATSYCDICEELGETKEAVVSKLFTNGKDSDDYNYVWSFGASGNQKLSATNTSKKVGAQGQLVEIYDVTGDDDETNVYRFVVVDTYLAKVTSVTAEKADKNDHVTRDAYATLTAYVKNAANKTVYVKGTDLVKDQYVLVNVNGSVTKTIKGLGAQALVEVVGEPDTLEGAQSVRYSNAGKHTVEGETYMDAAQYKLTSVGNSTKKYTWFFDQYGNLIGDAEIKTVYNYGVVTFLEKIDAVGEADYVVANLTYVDGTTETAVKVASIKMSSTAGAHDYINDVAYNSKNNETLNGVKVADHLFRIDTNKDGELELLETPETTGATAPKNTKLGAALLDDETVFMVRSGKGTSAKPYTFEFVTGKDNIGKYDEGTVHYVEDTDNGYADYVYVITEAKAATAYQFVFVTDNATGTYLDDSSVDYYVPLGIVGMDGEAVELKVETLAEWNQFRSALTTKGYMLLVKTVDGYVKEVKHIPGDGCTALLPTDNDYEAVRVATGNVAAAIAYHDAANVAVTGNYAENYNMTDVTVLLDGEVVDAAAYLTDDALTTEGVKTVYIVRDAEKAHLAQTVVLSTLATDNTWCEFHEFPTYAITVENNLSTSVDTAVTTKVYFQDVAITEAMEGWNVTLTLSAVEGYQDATDVHVTLNGVEKAVDSKKVTFQMPAEDVVLAITGTDAEKVQYTVKTAEDYSTVSKVTYGTEFASTLNTTGTSVEHGGSFSFKVNNVANDGKYIKAVTATGVTGALTAAENGVYTIPSVTANTTITVELDDITWDEVTIEYRYRAVSGTILDSATTHSNVKANAVALKTKYNESVPTKIGSADRTNGTVVVVKESDKTATVYYIYD